MTAGRWRVRAELAAVLPAPGWAILFGENDPSLHDLHFYVWVVTDGETLGLIDAGLPLDASEVDALSATNRAFGDDVGFRAVRTLPQILAEADIAAEDVDFVALTQTVTYHSGGVDAALLPNAVFYIARPGLMEFLDDPPGHPAPEFYFTDASWTSLRTLAIEKRLRLVEGSVAIRPGLRYEVTGGHHPGSAGVLLDTVDGRLGILESAFVTRNLETGRPIGIAEDIAAVRRAMASFGAQCDRVLAIHDPAHGEEFGGATDV